ncbi:MAG: glycosyltransferase, partial [Spirochaetaceae bacterium]|nr:glycosyltransferase [Spirochaetaceae bacterium]
DITISIDCDGQDDISTIEKMIDEYHNGNEVVYGVRSRRNTDTFFKRFTAELFYKILNAMGVEVIYNHADYRLISKKVLAEFSNFHETNLYLRGLIPLVGFKSTCVYYERHERLSGKSHYPFSKMLALAFDGITSLSIKPIRLIACFGGLISLFSFLYMLFIIILKITNFNNKFVPGWASIICVFCFISGIQILTLGIIGEYIGKIYMEVKARPRYIIEDRCGKRG